VSEPVRINLGSGMTPIEGWVNVDVLPDAPGVDVVADISERLPFSDGEAELLHASHLLEHFPTDDIPRMLREWRRVLKPGGKLLIAVPDLERISRVIVEKEGWFTPPHNPWLGAIYGGQKDAFDFHKTGYTEAWLAYLLQNAGFGELRRVERFAEVPVHDASFSPLPFGVNISLNMTAVADGADEIGGLMAGRRSERFLFDFVDKLLLLAMQVSTGLRARIMARRLRRIQAKLRSG
jgi:predicted SAM-dependent methyltransferase